MLYLISLLNEFCSKSLQVTADLRISDWQAIKHLVHANGMGVRPEDYGITQQELKKMQMKGDIVTYIRKDYKLPSREHLDAYKNLLKNICKNPSTSRRDDSEYFNPFGITPTTAFHKYDKENNKAYLVVFNQMPGDLITGGKRRTKTIEQFEKTNIIGAQK